MANKFLRNLIIAIIIIAALCAVCLAVFNMSRKNAQINQDQIAVVDLEKLIMAHPLSGKLIELDEKIAYVEEQLASAVNPFANVSAVMQKSQQEAAAELQEELVQIKKKLALEQGKLNEKLKEYRSEIVNEAQKNKEPFADDFTAPRKVTAKTLKGTLDQFAKDLVVLRDKQVAAKRLELQKQAAQEMRILKEKNERELAAYEQEILKKNQDEKINLGLKYSNTENPDERERIFKRLGQLEEEENKLKEEKQFQLNKNYEEAKNKRLQEIEKEASQYNYKLTKDISAQIKGKDAYQKKLTPAELSGTQDAAAKNKMEAVGDQYAAKMKELGAKYEKQFEAKKKALEEKLKKQENELVAEAMKKQKGAQGMQEQKKEEFKKQIEDLKEQRNRLYDQILSDVRLKIESIVKDEKIKYVLSGYVFKENIPDLTDKILNK